MRKKTSCRPTGVDFVLLCFIIVTWHIIQLMPLKHVQIELVPAIASLDAVDIMKHCTSAMKTMPRVQGSHLFMLGGASMCIRVSMCIPLSGE